MASPKADEKTPLVTRPSDLVEDDEVTGSLRDRVTVSYTTIALVSALLAGVSFLAYATPPSVIFSAAGGSAASAALAPQPAPQHKHKHEPTSKQIEHFLIEARNFTYQALFDIYGIGAAHPTHTHVQPLRAPPAADACGGAGGLLASNPLPKLRAPHAPAAVRAGPTGLPAPTGAPLCPGQSLEWQGSRVWREHPLQHVSGNAPPSHGDTPHAAACSSSPARRWPFPHTRNTLQRLVALPA